MTNAATHQTSAASVAFHAVAFEFAYTNRSNCRAAMRRWATANGQTADDFVVTEHGPRDFRFSRVAKEQPAPAAAAKPEVDDGIPAFLKIPAEVRRASWVANPPRNPRPALSIRPAPAVTALVEGPATSLVENGIEPATPVPAIGEEEAMKKILATRSRLNTPEARTAEAKAAKKSKAGAARTDGLRPGSKQAIMLDMVLNADGATENAICAKLGWKKCRVTLKRVCEKVGAKLETKRNVKEEVVFFATMPKARARA